MSADRCYFLTKVIDQLNGIKKVLENKYSREVSLEEVIAWLIETMPQDMKWAVEGYDQGLRKIGIKK